VMLGGRAAEHVVFGHFSTGAADDLERATRIARSMVTRYGMTELGHVSYEEENGHYLNGMGGPNPFFPRADKSDATAREIDVTVRALVEQAFQRARGILQRYQQVLLDAAKQLLEKETLVEADLKPIFARLQDGQVAGWASARHRGSLPFCGGAPCPSPRPSRAAPSPKRARRRSAGPPASS